MKELILQLGLAVASAAPLGAQDPQPQQTGAWWVLNRQDAMTDEKQTIVMASDSEPQRLASSPVEGEFAFVCMPGRVVKMLKVNVRYLAPTVTDATVQVRVGKAAPSAPVAWEPVDSRRGFILRALDGEALAQQLAAAVAQDSAVRLIVRATINDDETATFTFAGRGFVRAWAECTTAGGTP